MDGVGTMPTKSIQTHGRWPERHSAAQSRNGDGNMRPRWRDRAPMSYAEAGRSPLTRTGNDR